MRCRWQTALAAVALLCASLVGMIVVDATAAFAVDASNDDTFRAAFNDFGVTEIDLTADIQMDCPNDTAADSGPAWSPASSKLAFVRDGDIWVMDADGQNQVQLTTDAGTDRHPTWSPDGTRIAFESDRATDFEIWVMDADGQNQTQLTHLTDADEAPTWSPDGTMIAWASHQNGADFDIWVMDADGTDAEQLTTSMGNDQSPDFSPDGTRIAFESDRDGNRELYFMAGDGTGQTRLTTDAAADDQPAWSPSGTQIAWTTERDGDPEIYTMDVDVPPTNLVNISNAPSAVDDEPDWFAVSVPGAPQAVVAFGGPAQAMVTWSPPLAYGGSSITVYSATASPGDATCVWSSGPLQCTVMGLTNETMYSFTVTATNATGTGPASAPSSVVTPQAKPHKTGWPGWVDGDGPRRDLPDIFVTTEGEQAAVSFPAASSVPEDPVVGYEVTAQPGGQSASGAGPPITVTGLEPGVAYRFVVQATTAAGATATLGPSEEVLVGDPRSGAGPSADATDCAGTATSRHADLRAPGRAAGSLGLLVLGVGARHRREAVTSRVARRRARAGRARLTALAVTAGGMVALVAALTSQAADLSLC